MASGGSTLEKRNKVEVITEKPERTKKGGVIFLYFHGTFRTGASTKEGET